MFFDLDFRVMRIVYAFRLLFAYYILLNLLLVVLYCLCNYVCGYRLRCLGCKGLLVVCVCLFGVYCFDFGFCLIVGF